MEDFLLELNTVAKCSQAERQITSLISPGALCGSGEVRRIKVGIWFIFSVKLEKLKYIFIFQLQSKNEKVACFLAPKSVPQTLIHAPPLPLSLARAFSFFHTHAHTRAQPLQLAGVSHVPVLGDKGSRAPIG